MGLFCQKHSHKKHFWKYFWVALVLFLNQDDFICNDGRNFLHSRNSRDQDHKRQNKQRQSGSNRQIAGRLAVNCSLTHTATRKRMGQEVLYGKSNYRTPLSQSEVSMVSLLANQKHAFSIGSLISSFFLITAEKMSRIWVQGACPPSSHEHTHTHTHRES